MGGGARYDYDLWGKREKLAGDLEADLGYTGHFTHQGAKMVMAPFRQYDGKRPGNPPSELLTGRLLEERPV